MISCTAVESNFTTFPDQCTVYRSRPQPPLWVCSTCMIKCQHFSPPLKLLCRARQYSLTSQHFPISILQFSKDINVENFIFVTCQHLWVSFLSVPLKSLTLALSFGSKVCDWSNALIVNALILIPVVSNVSFSSLTYIIWIFLAVDHNAPHSVISVSTKNVCA